MYNADVHILFFFPLFRKYQLHVKDLPLSVLLKVDPQETRNRANNQMYREQANDEMKRQLIGFYRSEGYTAPMDGDDWKRHEIQRLPEDPDALLLFQDPPASIPNIPGRFLPGYL
jgi:hypothetical protein